MEDRKFRPRGTTGSSLFLMILDIRVVEDVSKHLDIPSLEFRAIWEHPPILPESWQILHQLLVHHNLVILQWHRCFLEQPSGTQTSLVQ